MQQNKTASGPEQAGNRRSPPNYFSRGVQYRLLVLTFSFMLVVVMMDEARDPSNWQWFFAGSDSIADGPPLTEEELADKPVDTLLGALERQEAARLGDEKKPDEEESIKALGASLQPMATPYELAQQDAWRDSLATLTRDQRGEVNLVLLFARRGEPLAEEHRVAALDALEMLDMAWRDYLQEARDALDDPEGELSATERNDWRGVIDQLTDEWDRLRTVLESCAEGSRLDAPLRSIVLQTQELIDAVDLAAVRDNTVMRAVESEAWFRLVEQLLAASNAQVEQEAADRVGFLSLFRQPKVYRGKLVTVRGVIRRGYRVSAAANLHGVDSYYVFWLRPAGGGDSPIVIYALDTPPGFPQIADKRRGEDFTELTEEAEFTGYFFKRWAYASRQGIRTAPLVLARSPTWRAPPPAAEKSLPSPGVLAMIILIAAAFGGGIAYFVYRQSLQTPQSTATFREALRRRTEKSAPLDALHPGKTVGARLQQLAARSDAGNARPAGESATTTEIDD